MEVADHPEADKLYILQVSIGKEKRQLVAGLKSYYKKDELTGKNIVVLMNLQPAKLRGVESQGMLLAADKDDTVGVLTTDAASGTSVLPEGYELGKIAQIDFKQFSKWAMKTSEKGVHYKNASLYAGKKLITAEKVGSGAKVR